MIAEKQFRAATGPAAVPAGGLTRRALGAFALALLAVTTLGGSIGSARAEDKAVSVGIIAGEDEDVWRVVTEEAAKRGLTVKTVVFSDYTQPNEALENREIDANAFQHKPYLDNQIKTQGYRIVPVGYTAVWPIGLYSRKFSSAEALPEGAVIGIPNDPSNEGRALRVLEGAGLIKLKPGTGILATVADVESNPKKLQIRELDAGIVGRSVDDLDAAVVNTDWAFKSGLNPATERIAQEPLADNPYRNFIAVREGDQNQPWVAVLVASYQNDAVKTALEKAYKGTGIPAW
ncbi:MetQ/NlpA family ABC transporter substrate-binding protein [Pseudoxanthobacter sp.]|uniref:MetQ/NlpA family ABC transporter substrate-binding protein n=1 Tax=Pseudoxanthobacter sp. TaxID=1925742 RepID=UPI002FE20D97